VIGGSEFYTGAPSLCALAALKSGVDLVYIAAPERAANVAANHIDLITIPLEGHYLNEAHVKEIRPWLDKADAVVIGPGLGLEASTKKTVLQLIKACEKPMVIDADALKVIGEDFTAPEEKHVILTPHRAEFKIISGDNPNRLNAVRYAKKSGAILVVKAHEDLITDGKKTEINQTGNPGMTVGGTGDVLSGVIAGLLAQGLKPFDAAKYGAEINGSAGDLAMEEKGFGFVASDMLEMIPKVMRWVQTD
jgi:NAD(P)H-hydrate epimerase